MTEDKRKGKPRKNPADRAEKRAETVIGGEPESYDLAFDTFSESTPSHVPQVQVEAPYPHIDDPVIRKKYKFINNSAPGMPCEFSHGRNVMNRAGRPTTVWEKWCLEDGFTYELPDYIAKKINSKVYKEQGQERPRATCVEV